jgi:glycine cleavage system H protein
MTGNTILLGLFSAAAAILLTMFSTIAIQTRRARKEPGEARRWREGFESLPGVARACRHELSGHACHRACARRFECETCADHPRLQGVDPASDGPGPGRKMRFDRLYHRGHTWARPEPGGTMVIGIDDLGRRLVGRYDAVRLPAPGSRLHRNRTAWRAFRYNHVARFLSPVDGIVTALGGPGEDWVIRVAPPAGGFETRHLLRGSEVTAWTMRETERLQLALSRPAPALADGGAMVEDLPADAPGADWDAIWKEMLLGA